MANQKRCPKCNNNEFGEGTDYMNIRPLDKKMSMGSPKIFTFCLNCGEVVSIRVESPETFRK